MLQISKRADMKWSNYKHENELKSSNFLFAIVLQLVFYASKLH